MITGRQVAAARSLIGWGQIELSVNARISMCTIRRMEMFDAEAVDCHTETLVKVISALEDGGVVVGMDGIPFLLQPRLVAL